MPNRSITLYKPETVDDLLILFDRADVPEGEINLLPMSTVVYKSKMRRSTLRISESAAKALFCALHDYFERVNVDLSDSSAPIHPNEADKESA